MAQYGNPFGSPFFLGLNALQRNWGWFMLLGILMMILGGAALWAAVLATLATVFVFGWFLFVSGILHWAYAFWSRGWGGVLLHLLGGVLGIVVGLMLLVRPFVGAEALTLLLSAYFIVSGVFRCISALTMRFRNWGWLLLSGIVGLVLGFLLWSQWPVSGLWAIGLFVGIDLIVYGWWLLALSLAVRSFPLPRTGSSEIGA